MSVEKFKLSSKGKELSALKVETLKNLSARISFKEDGKDLKYVDVSYGRSLKEANKYKELYDLLRTGTSRRHATLVEPTNSANLEIAEIERYISKELERINKNYNGETKQYLEEMLAYNVGHMVLSIDYKELSLKTLDQLFERFDTTFEEVKEAIRRDMNCQDL